MYAVRREPVSAAKKAQGPPAEDEPAPTPDTTGAPDDPELENDEGYGASHGYPPGHSGPSGPGDAPGS